MMKSLAAIAVIMSVMIMETNGNQKPIGCCLSVSTRKITVPITGFRYQSESLPCVKAVIFYTTEGEICVHGREKWVREKIRELRKLQGLQNMKPPSTQRPVSVQQQKKKSSETFFHTDPGFSKGQDDKTSCLAAELMFKAQTKKALEEERDFLRQMVLKLSGQYDKTSCLAAVLMFKAQTMALEEERDFLRQMVLNLSEIMSFSSPAKILRVEGEEFSIISPGLYESVGRMELLKELTEPGTYENIYGRIWLLKCRLEKIEKETHYGPFIDSP